jgi:uncharacterized protein with FMN-binding domain
MKRKALIIAGIVIAMLAGMLFAVTNGLSEGAAVTIDGVDLSNIADGNYTGTYDFKRWSNTVVVHIKDNRITSIEIEKDVMAAGITNASGEIIRGVIDTQNTTVDAVSGATVTSKAYLKAIEDALNGGAK